MCVRAAPAVGSQPECEQQPVEALAEGDCHTRSDCLTRSDCVHSELVAVTQHACV